MHVLGNGGKLDLFTHVYYSNRQYLTNTRTSKLISNPCSSRQDSVFQAADV